MCGRSTGTSEVRRPSRRSNGTWRDAEKARALAAAACRHQPAVAVLLLRHGDSGDGSSGGGPAARNPAPVGGYQLVLPVVMQRNGPAAGARIRPPQSVCRAFAPLSLPHPLPRALTGTQDSSLWISAPPSMPRAQCPKFTMRLGVCVLRAERTCAPQALDASRAAGLRVVRVFLLSTTGRDAPAAVGETLPTCCILASSSQGFQQERGGLPAG